jgi:hypothetical protein
MASRWWPSSCGGLVVAISFLEAPLGFRAPRGQPRMRPRLGWRVFATARTGEVVAVVTVMIAAAVDPPPLAGIIAAAIAIVTLAVALRVERLRRRFDAVPGAPDSSGGTPTRPDTGPDYIPVEIIILLEVAKVAALAVGAGGLLAM